MELMLGIMIGIIIGFIAGILFNKNLYVDIKYNIDNDDEEE